MGEDEREKEGERGRKVHLENKLRSPGKALDMMSI